MQNMLQEMQQQMEAAKKRLDEVIVSAEAGGGAVKVSATVNRKITEVIIDEEMIKEGDKEAIEDLVLTATNRVLELAEQRYESEMKGMASGLLPDLPGFS